MKEIEKVEFRDLIIKFFAGEISDNELDDLKSWLRLDPENRRIFNDENELWQEASFASNLENYKPDSAWKEISTRMGFEKSKGKSYSLIRKKSLRIFIAAATVACLIAIGGIGLWLTGKKTVRIAASASTIITTNEGEKSHVLLPDSTRIFLNSGSKLEYNGLYNINERVVKLTGEAFFDVHTNPEKPFVVQIAHMSVVATGTRFNILSYSNEDRVETTLEEGKVKVLIKGRESINLKTGEQVVYFNKSGKVEIHEVPTGTYTSWKENKLRFINTPFEETLRKIARKYNVTFEYTSKDLLDLKYTATFIDESIEDVMQMLKTVSPITYKIYNRTTVNDKQYLKPRIVVGKRKTI
jgi:ferric-dicitrate binding protein FerR (iron transport regulator)